MRMDWVASHLQHYTSGLALAARSLLDDVSNIENQDDRIGSARDNSTGGTLTHFNANNNEKDSASLEGLGLTFAPVLIYSGICFLIFFYFRRKSHRVYAPRSIPAIREPENPSPELPDGWFDWIKPFFAIDDDWILNNCSLDSYLFLRFLRILSVICLAGGCIAWPILLPIHGTGGNGLKDLEKLTMGNVKLGTKFYAHVVVAWLFFGFVLFMVVRECIFFINLRQAYLLSPNYASRLSSRTVLFTCIPKPYVNERKLRELFGPTVKNVWLVQDTGALEALVKDREETADRLQQAEIKLIRLANAARERYLKMNPDPYLTNDYSLLPQKSATEESRASESTQKDPEPGQAEIESVKKFAESQLSVLDKPAPPGEPQGPEDADYVHPYGLHSTLPDVRGSVAALWIPAESRPHHRPIQNFGRRVDTIRWTRARLKVLNRDIWNLRKKFRRGDGTPLNAAFIEFDSQASAQAAYQILAHHLPLHMSPRYIGLRPNEIIWSALRVRWWELIMRRFFMMAVIAAVVIFWSIPSAFLGGLTNIDKLSKMIPFLSFIGKLPSAIKGIIQGLLPALALSWFMSMVPWMLRGCAGVAGVPSHALVELFVQHAYFAFQVVQVFIVTTLTSAASAALTDVIQEPFSAKDLLAQNLPLASNFYLSYILIQCLAVGAARLANFGDLIRHELIASMTVNPRRRYARWRKLTQIHWGTEYPRFTNMGVIALSYSCISPLILVFAGLGMLFISYVFRYCILYIYDSSLDTRGLFYPRALLHLMVGLYIAEICLVGLFALKSAFGPLLLMLIFLIFTAIVHVNLNSALTPLLDNIPRTLALERDNGPSDDSSHTMEEGAAAEGENKSAKDTTGLAADYYNMASESDSDSDDEAPPVSEPGLDSDIQLRGIEGSSSIKYAITEWIKSQLKSPLKLSTSLRPTTDPTPDSRLTQILAAIKNSLTPDPSRPPNLLLTFLHPEIYQDFRTLAKRVNPQPAELPDLPPNYVKRSAYQPPEMWIPAPKLWLPRDEARVSRQEVAHCRKEGIFAGDKGCWLVGGDGVDPRVKERLGKETVVEGQEDGKGIDLGVATGVVNRVTGFGKEVGKGVRSMKRGRVVCEMEKSPLKEEIWVY